MVVKNIISEQIEECITYISDINNLLTFDTITNIKNSGFVYCIYIVNEKQIPKLVYIGKSKGHLFKTRIKNHFVSKNEHTGAKLDLIIQERLNGNEIKIKYIITEPESYRNMLEEELINHFKPIWNIQKKKVQ
ncbi:MULTISPECIES: hypothetical protein [Chryseobacterium]|uniref:hypothetical protein n=1 Tax=Chryseobacterium TaxID=59732 RepID=UPI00301953FF